MKIDRHMIAGTALGLLMATAQGAAAAPSSGETQPAVQRPAETPIVLAQTDIEVLKEKLKDPGLTDEQRKEIQQQIDAMQGAAAPAEQAKPAEQAPAEAQKPAEEAKPAEQAPAEPQKPAEQAAPAEEQKPAEEAKPAEAEQPKPAEQAAPAEQPKPAEGFGFAWLTLRQVQEALKTGRLEEALRLLRLPGVRNHRRAGELLVHLARAFAERGERQVGLDGTEQAWNDLLQAEALQTGEKTPERLRQALVRLGMAELRGLLLAGEVVRAEEAALRLRQRQVASAELGVLEEGLRGWLRARELAERGEMALASEMADRAGRLLGANAQFEAFRSELSQHLQTLPTLLAHLHEAAGAERWREVLELCERTLAIAPAHAEARALRSRAWRVLEPTTVALDGESNEPALESLPPRFWLWIDGVGGYLVCLGSRLTFGQALPEARVDIPLVADVSRFHASLARDGEGYVLESSRPMQVNGATVTKSPLQSGDRFTLGTTCQFVFRLPVPGSMTARVDLTSGHRLPMSVEGVVLMAETLVIGPTTQAHVVAEDLKQPLVLFRHKDGLGVRYKGEVKVNGQLSSGRAFLPPVATVNAADITFAIEPTK